MTDSVPLNVKWGKEAIKVDFVVDSGVKGLKTELEEQTGVPADRMKLMAKSKGTFFVSLLLLYTNDFYLLILTTTCLLFLLYS